MRCTALLTLALAVCLPAQAAAQDTGARHARVSPPWSGHSLNTDSILARADSAVARARPTTRLPIPGAPWLAISIPRRPADRTGALIGGVVGMMIAEVLQRTGKLPRTVELRLHRELAIGYPVYVGSEILAPAGSALSMLISRQFD